jgi:transcriptional regulator of heat shock response
VSRSRDALGRFGRAPSQLITRYFNRRFADVHEHLDNESAAVNAQVEEMLATTRELQERVTTDLEVLSELTLSLERLVRRLEERMEAQELERDRRHEHSTKA